MEQRIFDIIMKGDEVTWQSLIQDLVRVENMDPWDIDISKLTQRYIEMLRKMQELDLKISGKVILAAAIMLKLKSTYLVGRDLENFDKLLHPDEYAEDELYDEHPAERPHVNLDEVRLIPRTPQPRKRKVSVYDLVEALKQALDVQSRRRQVLDSIEIKVPEKKVDITKVIEDLYVNIENLYKKHGKLTFSQLVPSGKKEDVIAAFIPVLHLSTQQRVELEQMEHFGEINIELTGKRKKDDIEEVQIDESEFKEEENVHKGRKENP